MWMQLFYVAVRKGWKYVCENGSTVCLCDPVFQQAPQIPRDGSSTPRWSHVKLPNTPQIPPGLCSVELLLLCFPFTSLFHSDFIPCYFASTQLRKGAICDSCDMLLAVDMHGVSQLTSSILSEKRWAAPDSTLCSTYHGACTASKAIHTVLEKHPPRQKSITKKNSFVL